MKPFMGFHSGFVLHFVHMLKFQNLELKLLGLGSTSLSVNDFLGSRLEAKGQALSDLGQALSDLCETSALHGVSNI